MRQCDQAMASAAARHLRDARLLLDGVTQGAATYRSIDQAWHLAGFGPECIRKACIASRYHRSLGHDLSRSSDDLVALLIETDPALTRYRLETSHITALQRVASERFVERVSLALWLDGSLGCWQSG
jgi:hypothetical protein